MQTAVGGDEAPASAPTLGRLETRATRAQAWALHEVLIEQPIASHERASTGLVIDVGASDVPLHGEQELREVHGHYDHRCDLPRYGFCGQAMLACHLRRNRIDGAKNLTAVLKRINGRLRQAWPEVPIIVRGDSGFHWRRCAGASASGWATSWAWRVTRDWSTKPRWWNRRWPSSTAPAAGSSARSASSLTPPRAGRTSAESSPGSSTEPRGNNPRFAVTDVEGRAEELYDALNCRHGKAENQIEEVPLDLFGTWASCHKFVANQFRLLRVALAYTLMDRLRTLALQATESANASAATIRVRLLKIGVVMLRNTRRVRLRYASNHPLRELFALVAVRLGGAGP